MISNNHGDRPTKLAKYISHSMFLDFMATNINMIFMDANNNQMECPHHFLFDDGHYNQ